MKRSVSNLSGSVGYHHAGPKITDPSLEKLLTGLYKSNNVNLHEFRRPVGMLLNKTAATKNYEDVDIASQYSNLLNSGQPKPGVHDFNIVEPKEFVVLKGHTVDRERALQSQQRFQKENIVRSGSKYYSTGPPVTCCGERHLDSLKDLGPGFRTATKAQDEASRVKKRHFDNPVMAKTPSNSNLNKTDKSEAIEISLKNLERNFRKESSHPSRTSWKQFKPLNTSDDPYIA